MNSQKIWKSSALIHTSYGHGRRNLQHPALGVKTNKIKKKKHNKKIAISRLKMFIEIKKII